MRRWGRRSVGRHAVLAMALLLALGLALPLGGTSARAQARSGGTVVMLSGQNIQSINVLFTAAGLALSAAKQVQRGLLFYDEKDEFTGELAEEVPSLRNGGISQDRKSITYKLRKNVKWHDGKPVTSADVKFTWQAIMNPTSKVVSRYGYDQIETVDTPDPYTVVVRFKKPFAPWAILFDALIPKHLLENEPNLAEASFNRKPIGFGPMKFAEWVSGDHITWEANSDYFRGAPKIDRFILRFVPSTEAVLNAIRAGEVEIGWGLNEPSIPQLRQLESRGIRTIVDVIPNSHRYNFNMDHTKVPLFADLRVRKAIALAINKQDLIDKLLYGITKPGRSEWDNTYWENKNLRPYPYDPEQAKKLLDDAGWKVGSDGIRAKGNQRLSFTHSTYTGDQLLENVQLFVQRNLKDVGVEMKIRNVALATAFASFQAGGTWATGQYEMGGWFHGLRNPDPDLSFRFHSGQIPSAANPAGSQWYHYSNPQVDKLFDQQANIFDPAERKKVMDEIQRLIHEDYPVIYLYDFTSIYAVKSTLKNFQPHAWGNFYWNIWQWELQR